MTISFNYNLTVTNAAYVAAAGHISEHFYQNHRFYVLDYLPAKFRDRVVFFPRTQSISELIEEGTKAFEQPLLKRISKYRHYFDRKVERLESEIKSVTNPFNDMCEQKIGKTSSRNIVIEPILVGSVGTYKFCDDYISIRPRFDRSLSQMMALAVNALVHYQLHGARPITSDTDWRYKQAQAAKIFHSADFKRLFQDVSEMNYILSVQTVGSLAKESYTYLTDLGYGIKSQLPNPIDVLNLTSQEKLLLELLIKNKPNVVSIDTIATALWTNAFEEKFSLYAITKLIERLRAKLKKAGINQQLIHAQRGVGYFLYD